MSQILEALTADLTYGNFMYVFIPYGATQMEFLLPATSICKCCHFLARLLPKADKVMPLEISNCLHLTPNRMQNYK